MVPAHTVLEGVAEIETAGVTAGAIERLPRSVVPLVMPVIIDTADTRMLPLGEPVDVAETRRFVMVKKSRDAVPDVVKVTVMLDELKDTRVDVISPPDVPITGVPEKNQPAGGTKVMLGKPEPKSLLKPSVIVIVPVALTPVATELQMLVPAAAGETITVA